MRGQKLYSHMYATLHELTNITSNDSWPSDVPVIILCEFGTRVNQFYCHSNRHSRDHFPTSFPRFSRSEGGQERTLQTRLTISDPFLRHSDPFHATTRDFENIVDRQNLYFYPGSSNSERKHRGSSSYPKSSQRSL